MLFSNNDVILQSEGGGGQKRPKNAVILNVWPLNRMGNTGGQGGGHPLSWLKSAHTHPGAEIPPLWNGLDTPSTIKPAFEMPIFSQGWDFGWNAMFRNGGVRNR